MNIGIFIKLESYCLCSKKDINGVQMDKLSETFNLTLNIVNSVFRCPLCGNTHSVSVKLTYSDIHKGVRLT
jgi:hypothetical protein